MSDTQKLDRILFILESNESLDQEGLIKKVHRIDDTQKQLLEREKVYKAKILAWAAGASVVFTAMAAGAKALLIKLLSL